MNRRVLLLVAALVVAALGTSLLFVYVNGVNSRALAGTNPQTVLVAKNLIPAGTEVSVATAHGDFAQKNLPKDAVVAGALSQFTSAQDSQILQTTVYPGQQVVAAELANTPAASAAPSGISLPTGDVAISVELQDPNRVAGFVNPGSNVVVFITPHLTGNNNGGSGGNAAAQPTRVLLKQVEVVAVGPTTVTTPPPGQGNPEAVSRALLTFAVTQKQAEQLIYGQQNGDLYLGLLNSGSKVTPDNGVGAGNLFS